MSFLDDLATLCETTTGLTCGINHDPGGSCVVLVINSYDQNELQQVERWEIAVLYCSISDDWSANFEAAKNLMLVLKQKKCDYLYSGSDYVAAITEITPFTTDTDNKNRFYGAQTFDVLKRPFES